MLNINISSFFLFSFFHFLYSNRLQCGSLLMFYCSLLPPPSSFSCVAVRIVSTLQRMNVYIFSASPYLFCLHFIRWTVIQCLCIYSERHSYGAHTRNDFFISTEKFRKKANQLDSENNVFIGYFFRRCRCFYCSFFSTLNVFSVLRWFSSVFVYVFILFLEKQKKHETSIETTHTWNL